MSNTSSESARFMVRRALKGALATLDAASGAPYASMVILATDVAGAPLTLVSTLARHTQNLAASPLASILIDTSNAAGDALSGGRITLQGALKPTPDPTALARFVARHPEAAQYAGFADFSMYRLDVTSAHFIQGFGRIMTLPADSVMLPAAGLAAFAAAEPARVASLKERWPSVTGFDPEGVDLVNGSDAHRLLFSYRQATAEAAYAAAMALLATQDRS